MTGSVPDLGRVVAAQRKKMGLSQVEFAARLGRSETWVSQVERGVRHIDRMSVLQRLADALDLPVAALARSEAVTGPPKPEAAVNAALALSASVTLAAMVDDRAETVSVRDLAAAADEAWSLVHASQHAGVAALLNTWLPVAVSVSTRGGSKDRRQAAEAACRLLLASAAMLSKVDDPAAAWVQPTGRRGLRSRRVTRCSLRRPFSVLGWCSRRRAGSTSRPGPSGRATWR